MGVTSPEAEMLKEVDLAAMTETEERNISKGREAILDQTETEGTKKTRKVNVREVGQGLQSGKSGEEKEVVAETDNIGLLVILMIEETNMSTKTTRTSTKRERE